MWTGTPTPTAGPSASGATHPCPKSATASRRPVGHWCWQKNSASVRQAFFGGCSVAISGRTPLAEASLRHTRRLLRDVTGIHRADFKTYDFHITLAYPLRWLTEGEAVAVVDLSDRVFTRLSEQVAHITLGPVEFCTFDHMHAFSPLVVLDGHSGTKLRGAAEKLSQNRCPQSG